MIWHANISFGRKIVSHGMTLSLLEDDADIKVTINIVWSVLSDSTSLRIFKHRYFVNQTFN